MMMNQAGNPDPLLFAALRRRAAQKRAGISPGAGLAGAIGPIAQSIGSAAPQLPVAPGVVGPAMPTMRSGGGMGFDGLRKQSIDAYEDSSHQGQEGGGGGTGDHQEFTVPESGTPAVASPSPAPPGATAGPTSDQSAMDAIMQAAMKRRMALNDSQQSGTVVRPNMDNGAQSYTM